MGFVDLLIAVAAGMVLSSLLFMKKVSDVNEARSKSAPIKDFTPEKARDDEKEGLERLGDRIIIKHFDGPLFFGFASKFSEMIMKIPKTELVVIRMDKVPYIDQSGLYAMETAIKDLLNAGITVAFTDLQGQPKQMLEQFKVVPDLVKEEHC